MDRFVVSGDCGGVPGFYAMLEAVIDPHHANHAEAKRFPHKFLLNDTTGERRISLLARQRKSGRREWVESLVSRAPVSAKSNLTKMFGDCVVDEPCTMC
jgi:hypothetical protein